MIGKDKLQNGFITYVGGEVGFRENRRDGGNLYSSKRGTKVF
jgi:hypothetical protein